MCYRKIISFVLTFLFLSAASLSASDFNLDAASVERDAVQNDIIESLKLSDQDKFFLEKAVFHQQLGVYYFFEEDFKSALKHLNIANNYCPNYPPFIIRIGQVYAALGHSEKASVYYQKAYALDSSLEFLKDK